MRPVHVLVMAKAPVPGRVKTRLCPPLSEHQAAGLAEAALADTLEAVARSGAQRRLVALDGEPGDWLPPGFEVIAQRGDRFDERLAAAWEVAGGPGLQIGMDTPQVTPELLDQCISLLEPAGSPQRCGKRAVLGPACDGGWWAIGLPSPDREVFAGIAMSTSTTGKDQLRRLVELGHDTVLLPVLRDFDYVEDAAVIAGDIPDSRFARAFCAMSTAVAS